MAEPSRLQLHQDMALGFAEGSREEVLETWRAQTQAAGTNLVCDPGVELAGLETSDGLFTLILKNGERLKSKNVVLAFGVQGNLRKFGVPGQGRPHVAYQLDDPAAFQGRKIVVVGVGDAGIENALALAQQNDVSIVNRGEEFPKAKPKNRALIEAAIESGGITHYPTSRPKRIEEDHIVLETSDGEVRVEASLVIGRLGAVASRKFLENLNIEFPTPDPAAAPVISDHYESNVAGLYLIGAVAGYPLIKNCVNQGYEVVEQILGNPVTPADEPLLENVLGTLEGSVDSILEEIGRKLPIFSNITRIQLREFLVDSTIHSPSKDEVIFERNDYSDSFYSILRGSVQIVAPPSDADTNIDRLPDALSAQQRFVLGEGEFFGEMSLISGRRRSSTVIAGGQCVLIETPRLSMIRLKTSVPEVDNIINEVFIRRKLQSGLAPDVPVEELQELAEHAMVETYRQGEELFHEGDPNNGLHLIRRGSVTVWRLKDQEKQVLAYLPAGNVVGEMAFFAPDARRNATVQASVLTETIRLPARTIASFHERHPEIHREKKTANERLIENSLRSSDRRAGGIVEFLMEAGAGEATDILLVDESLCIRCDNCEKACAGTHGGVSRLDREAGPTFASLHIPTSCRHCENPKCMMNCPPDAIRRKPSGEVYIMDNCIGCGNCAANCPYDVIQMAAVDPTPPPNLLMRLFFGAGEARAAGNEEGKKLAVKCDLCSSLPAGPSADGKRAACVESCPTGAVLRVNPSDYVEKVMEEALET